MLYLSYNTAYLGNTHTRNAETGDIKSTHNLLRSHIIRTYGQ
jgi:hypothetical protein